MDRPRPPPRSQLIVIPPRAPPTCSHRLASPHAWLQPRPRLVLAAIMNCFSIGARSHDISFAYPPSRPAGGSNQSIGCRPEGRRRSLTGTLTPPPPPRLDGSVLRPTRRTLRPRCDPLSAQIQAPPMKFHTRYVVHHLVDTFASLHAGRSAARAECWRRAAARAECWRWYCNGKPLLASCPHSRDTRVQRIRDTLIVRIRAPCHAGDSGRCTGRSRCIAAVRASPLCSAMPFPPSLRLFGVRESVGSMGLPGHSHTGKVSSGVPMACAPMSQRRPI